MSAASDRSRKSAALRKARELLGGETTGGDALRLYAWLTERPGWKANGRAILNGGPACVRSRDKRDAALDLLEASELAEHGEGGTIYALDPCAAPGGALIPSELSNHTGADPMVRIFRDTVTGAFVIQTNAADENEYLLGLGGALAQAALASEDAEATIVGVLRNAFPIAYRISGYRAETVAEQRVLTCGAVSPIACDVVASSGRAIGPMDAPLGVDR